METNDEKKEPFMFKIWHLTLLLILMSSAIFVAGRNASDFMASVIATKTAPPFDGTALPILNVPKWTSLTTAEYKLPYDSIPADKLIALPVYDPVVLKTPTENLGWKSASDLNIRNSKITFSTPYLGNYKLDGLEYAGSHPAVDIKVPLNTPVYAIANGIVSEAVDQTTGYGKHIVIKHENVPSLSDPNKKVTLYSSYSHLSEMFVSQGDVVTKGQLIAKSGQTGTATTPHLHFQIDTDQAPFHPYWPFTSLEASAAGLSFFEAVNAGFNAEKAIAVTVNPLLYAQKYLGGSVSADSQIESNTTTIDTQAKNMISEESTVSSQPKNVSESDQINSAQPVKDFVDAKTKPLLDSAPEQYQTEDTVASKFRVEANDTFVVNVPQKMIVTAEDDLGNVAVKYKPSEYVYLKVELGGANLPRYLNKNDFVDGKAIFEFTPTAANGLQISVTDGSISGISKVLQSQIFSDLEASARNFKAISFLKKYSVIGGYPDGTFKPDNVVSRVEALKFILEAAKVGLIKGDKLPFRDILAGQWYSDYVATGFKKNIVAGYEDKTFKPSNTVNRVEFLKMLVVAMDFKVNPIVTRDPYDDVSKEAWFAAYVKFAKEKNLFDVSGRKFKPQQGMTRAEVAETVYRSIMLKLSDANVYTEGLSVSTAKADKYFS